jgi:hypothetical protein
VPTNDLLILCGSLGRPQLPLLKWIDSPQVFVEPQEEKLYRASHPELTYHIHPKSEGGFSFMMNQLVKKTLDMGQRYFVFTDDDVFGLKARNSCLDRFQRVKNEEAVSALKKTRDSAQKAGLAQMTVSFAAVAWAATKDFQLNAGAWGVHVTDAEAVKMVGGYDESLIIFSDWELSARLMVSGYRTAKTNLVCFEHKMKSMSGGAEGIYAQREKIEKSGREIIRRYGSDVCKLVWVESHGQPEIRFNWNKLVEKYRLKP